MLNMTYKNKTVQKHVRGNWYARVRRNGKMICVYGRTKAETYEKFKVLCDIIAGEKLNGKLSAIKEKTVSAQDRKIIGYTLMEWFEKWLNTYKVGNLRQSSIYGFKKDIRALQGLHNEKLTNITNMMLSEALNGIKSDATKDKAHNLLKQLFSAAFNNHLIESNPASHLPRPKQSVKFVKKVLTANQEKKFIEICLSNLKDYEPLLICVLQGIRRGEMLALRPNDFDFENNTLRIDESYDVKFPEDLRTKNATSNRIMPMFEITKRVLERYKHYPPDSRIYENIGADTIARNLAKLLLLNGLPRLTLHELRHTFITRCHERGIEEIIVQRWVGHAPGSRMTKAVYTHIDADTERKYIETMNGKAN